MADISWAVRRLRAMSVPEVIWRLSQVSIRKIEKKKFGTQKITVISSLFHIQLKDLKINAERMHLNFENTEYSLETSIPLLGGYDYSVYKKHWNAGFQTDRNWPDKFSYSLEYKQRDDIGDARTNWELNRHYQFVLLAKKYRITGNKKYLAELVDLFEDWNNHNPFLWGISWTSVMEAAIRCSNWCYTYCFLDNMPGVEKIQKELRIGILNIADYIVAHYSRYSSANNHLIVEAYAIGQVGILTNYQPWIGLSVKILTREFPLQNYSDGVNKELSLHYQNFYMEAVGLMMRLLVKNNITVPDIWYHWLDKLSQYVCDCVGNYGEIVEFGDNDEGKILDLTGIKFNYYQYVLQFMSCLLRKRYLNGIGTIENIRWLFTQEDIKTANTKDLYVPENNTCYREGGNTILRSSDKKIFIGIDHAALGFGSIAAHGHADALSFQMFVEGVPVFVDPGTYIYHCNIESRNAYRKTRNHNTVCIDNQDQSEMLGAFLWGKKAKCELIDFKTDMDIGIELKAIVKTYKGKTHFRGYKFNGINRLFVIDSVESPDLCEAEFLLGESCRLISNEGSMISFSTNRYLFSVNIENSNCIEIDENVIYSDNYGIRKVIQGIRVKFRHYLKTEIIWQNIVSSTD